MNRRRMLPVGALLFAGGFTLWQNMAVGDLEVTVAALPPQDVPDSIETGKGRGSSIVGQIERRRVVNEGTTQDGRTGRLLSSPRPTEGARESVLDGVLEIIELFPPVRTAGEDGYETEMVTREWREWSEQQVVPLTEEETVRSDALYLTRVGDGPIHTAWGDDLPEVQTWPELREAPVVVDFEPKLPEEYVRDYAVTVTPIGDVAYLEEEMLYDLKPRLAGLPVACTDPVILRQSLFLGGLLRGMRYDLSLSYEGSDESTKGSRIDIGVVEFSAPGRLIVPWREAPGLVFQVQGMKNAKGTVYCRRVEGSSRSPRKLAVLNNGQAWYATDPLKDGTYDVFAAGSDWTCARPFPRIHISDGVPDTSPIYLVAEKGGGTQIRFDIELEALTRANVSYIDASGIMKPFPTTLLTEGPGVFRWSGNTLGISKLLEPVDLLISMPAIGTTVCLWVRPGAHLVVEPQVVAPRLFEAALGRARKLTLQYPGGGRAFLQKRVVPVKSEPVWAHVKYFNLGLPGYWKPVEWTVPVEEGLNYRFRFHTPEGAVVYVPIDR